MTRRYADRRDAGRTLASMIQGYRGVGGLLVLGLPRGGLPVADEVARSLDAPLDVLVVRKLGMPGQPEVAMGAIASLAGTIHTVENPAVTGRSPELRPAFEEVAAAEEKELRRRQQAYRGDRAPLDLRGRVIVLVDDGLATGATMRAAASVVREEGAAKLIVAAPIGLSGACAQLRRLADEVVCAWESDELFSVGQSYRDFTQTSDDEVREILDGAARRGIQHRTESR